MLTPTLQYLLDISCAFESGGMVFPLRRSWSSIGTPEVPTWKLKYGDRSHELMVT